MPSPPLSGPDLILVPTGLELRQLEQLGALPHAAGRCAPCGFGPVSAAARTAQLLGELRPRRVLLVGIAGSLDLERAPLASAKSFARVHLDGVGAGTGAGFLPPSRLGFPLWEGEPGQRITETLDLPAGGPGELVTVCASSASSGEAAARRERHPGATAEDMEGFAVALACRLAGGVPLVLVRGIANAAGHRDRSAWCVPEALAAARLLALEWLERADWGAGREGP